MSHRRPILTERGPEPNPPAPEPLPQQAHYAKAGHCPKCGEHVGYAVRAHAVNCQGPPQ